MRVMVLQSPGGSMSVRGGWIRALIHAGHEAAWWSPREKSAFDAFQEYEPSLTILTTYDLDDAQEKCIRARPDMKVALFASAWGEKADALPLEEFPIVRVTDAEKRRLERLKRETGKPDCVFLHCSDSNVESVLGGWREIGIEPIGLMNAADALLYRPGRFRPEFACDACFVGGRWPYKARNIDPFILSLAEHAPFRLKVFGYGGWEDTTPYYLGRLDELDEPDLFASSAVCLNFSEPHSTDPRYASDIVERPFKVMACGGCLVSDHVEEMKEIFPFVPTARTREDFRDLAEYLLERPDERQWLSSEGRAEVMSRHTYHHRMYRLFHRLGWPQEGDRILTSLPKIWGRTSHD